MHIHFNSSANFKNMCFISSKSTSRLFNFPTQLLLKWSLEMVCESFLPALWANVNLAVPLSLPPFSHLSSVFIPSLSLSVSWGFIFTVCWLRFEPPSSLFASFIYFFYLSPILASLSLCLSFKSTFLSSFHLSLPHVSAELPISV